MIFIKRDKNFIEQLEEAVQKDETKKKGREDYEEVKQLMSWLEEALYNKEQRDKHTKSKYF